MPPLESLSGLNSDGDVPKNFDKYDIGASFLENGWSTLSTLLVVLALALIISGFERLAYERNMIKIFPILH